jgi:hypothetical protein
MVPPGRRPYGAAMSTAEPPDDLTRALGRAFRRLYERHSGTQESWEGASGMAQSTVSHLKNGQKWGMDALRRGLKRAEIDPLDLLREAAAEVVPLEDREVEELVRLFRAAPKPVQSSTLLNLRAIATLVDARRASR